MGRVIIGAVAAAIAMFIVGAIFLATPLIGVGWGTVDNLPAAEVRGALAANLPESGTYLVPGTQTPEQTAMYGQGPVATIHYNVGGSALDPATMLLAFVFYLVIAFFLAGGLWAVERQVRDFGSRARVVVAFVVAISAYANFRMPVWYHHDWGNAFYFFLADAVTLIAGGLIIARWFLPRARSAPAEAPTEV